MFQTIGLLENLKGLQLANNPLIYPDRSIINQGLSAIFDFLKKEAISSGICEEKKEIISKKSLVKSKIKIFNFKWNLLNYFLILFKNLCIISNLE